MCCTDNKRCGECKYFQQTTGSATSQGFHMRHILDHQWRQVWKSQGEHRSYCRAEQEPEKQLIHNVLMYISISVQTDNQS